MIPPAFFIPGYIASLLQIIDYFLYASLTQTDFTGYRLGGTARILGYEYENTAVV